MMDERRDLVDRPELRRALNLLVDERHYLPVWNEAVGVAIDTLDAMDSVECPRGWTREEVLAELDAAKQRGDKAVVKELTAFLGFWTTRGRDWVERWERPDVPRTNVRVEVVERAPEWVPLTQLVGRTIDGCDEAVYRTNSPHPGREAPWRWRPGPVPKRLFPEGTLNLETGLVAVRPKATT